MDKIRLFFSRAPSAAAALVLCVSLAFGAVARYFVSCDRVREGVLRLHVIAASDSVADQTVKLAVRDEVLRTGAAIFDGSVTADQARERIAPFLPRLEEAANRVLRAEGFAYTATARLTEEYFDARSYDGVTLPAGRYRALKIVLGEGQGQNWWCVMFPPLCLPAVTGEPEDVYAVFNGDGAKVVQGEPEYEIRFKIVELVERAVEKIKNRRTERALAEKTDRPG